jgi:hypothetical protein
MNENVIKLQNALENNELFTFLTGGKKDYYFICRYADMPTDPDQAFSALKDYYDESNDLSIWTKFQTELLEMTKSAENTWLSIYYLSAYLPYQKFAHMDFIDMPLIVKNIHYGLISFKHELSTIKRWNGAQFDNGLFDDSCRLLNNLSNSYNMDLSLDKTF